MNTEPETFTVYDIASLRAAAELVSRGLLHPHMALKYVAGWTDEMIKENDRLLGFTPRPDESNS